MIEPVDHLPERRYMQDIPDLEEAFVNDLRQIIKYRIKYCKISIPGDAYKSAFMYCEIKAVQAEMMEIFSGWEPSNRMQKAPTGSIMTGPIFDFNFYMSEDGQSLDCYATFNICLWDALVFSAKKAIEF